MANHLVAVYTDDPYDQPYRLYVGEDDQLVSTMTLLHDFGTWREFDPKFASIVEDVLLRWGYSVVSEWADDGVEFWVAKVVRTN